MFKCLHNFHTVLEDCLEGAAAIVGLVTGFATGFVGAGFAATGFVGAGEDGVVGEGSFPPNALYLLPSVSGPISLCKFASN